MASINDFKAALTDGGARANQFRVVLPPLNGVGQTSTFLCKSASIPASTIQDIPIIYRGREVHFAGERTFQPWNVTILNDQDFKTRRELERWQATIQQFGMTGGVVQPGSYQRPITVQQLARNGTVIQTYEFVDAYPTEIGEIQVSWDQDVIEEYSVTFTYNYFLSKEGAAGQAVDDSTTIPGLGAVTVGNNG